jgi:hypothetical protein
MSQYQNMNQFDGRQAQTQRQSQIQGMSPIRDGAPDPVTQKPSHQAEGTPSC